MDEPTPPTPPTPPPTDADIARQAFISSVASNVAMIAVVLAVNVAVAKRDVITRAWRRATGAAQKNARRAHESRELAAFRRDVSEISHAIGADSEP
jgi:hypothetical protein